MLTEKLLETLRSERESLDAAITIIENRLQRSAVRKKILHNIKRTVHNGGKRRKGTSAKGFKYKGTHWTQKPENRDRLIAMVKRSAKKRNSK